MSDEKKATGVGFFLRIGLTLLVIAAVVAGLLAAINSLTADKIAENEKGAVARYIEEIFGDDFASYEETPVKADNVESMYLVKCKDGREAYCFRATGNGFGGAVTFIIGTDPEGSIIGIKTLSHSETPGVGTKAVDNEAGYLKTYTGKNAADADKVDAKTGATYSSKAVKSAVKAVSALLAEQNTKGGEDQ